MMLAILRGELIAIEPMREIAVDNKRLKIARALFLIKFGLLSKMAAMTFWEEDTYQMSKLQLGKEYNFTVGLEPNGDQFTLHFLSDFTEFKGVQIPRVE